MAAAEPRGPIRLGPGAEFDLVRAFLEAASAARGGETGSRAPAAEAPAEPSGAAAGRSGSDVRLFPVGDDATAVRVPAGEFVVLSTDASVEDVHFRREWMRWEAVGYRATAASLSDLAAMAARPIGVLVSLLLPPELERDVVASLAAGVGDCLRVHDGILLGGDVSRSPGPVALDVVAVGRAARPVSRRGARPGDELWVTGSLGEAAAALWDLSRFLEPHPAARRRLERPPARLREALWLASRTGLRAMLDISDGLGGDAGHLAAASGVRLEIFLDRLPLAEPLEGYASREAALRLALTGGEDYELLFAAEPGTVEPVRRAFAEETGTALTRIGVVTEGRGLRWLERDGSESRLAPAGGYDHFRGARGGSPARDRGGRRDPA